MGRGTLVEAPDADTVYARLRWTLALVLLALATLAVADRCGRETALLFAAPTLVAFALRALTRRIALDSAVWQGFLASALVAWQIVWLWPALGTMWQLGCIAPVGDALPWLAAPVIFAGWSRSRWPLALTAIVWSTAVCVDCGAAGSTCTAAQPARPAAAIVTPTRPTSRTDSDGRWPAPPGQLQWGVPDGTGPVPHSGAPGGERPDWSGAPGGSLPGMEAVPIPTAPGGSDAFAVSRPEGQVPVDVSSQPSARTPRAVSTDVPGGWLAPDHRRTDREMTLISIEQANRTPSEFFGSGGQRRVYLPTDPIFEPGGSRIRPEGGLSLSRLAALLALHSDRHVTLEVHTDAGGSVEAKAELSDRRAGAIRTWLIDRGHIAPGRFDVAGVGARKPLVPPDGSWAAQQPNRRIEVRLVE